MYPNAIAQPTKEQKEGANQPYNCKNSVHLFFWGLEIVFKWVF
jgi:hypothetical protein